MQQRPRVAEKEEPQSLMRFAKDSTVTTDTSDTPHVTQRYDRNESLTQILEALNDLAVEHGDEGRC